MLRKHYEVLTEIGKGNFGRIYKIIRKTDKTVFACKEIYYGNGDEIDKQHIINEINILRTLNSPNIVKYHEHINDKTKSIIYIIMEYCSTGDGSQLINYHRDSCTFIPEYTIWKIYYQLLSAVKACHRNKSGVILHRDIKPSNVFISNNNIKLGDFGLSTVGDAKSDLAKSNVGTPYYMSPEKINNEMYNDKSDIWAGGCVGYELCALKRPFEASNHLNLGLKINKGDMSAIPYQYSEELNDGIMWILTNNYKERPGIDDLLNDKREKELDMREKYGVQRENEIKEKEKDLIKGGEQLKKEGNKINEMNIKGKEFVGTDLLNYNYGSMNYITPAKGKGKMNISIGNNTDKDSSVAKNRSSRSGGTTSRSLSTVYSLKNTGEKHRDYEVVDEEYDMQPVNLNIYY